MTSPAQSVTRAPNTSSGKNMITSSHNLRTDVRAGVAGEVCPRCGGQVFPNYEGVHCLQCGWEEWRPRTTSRRKTAVSGRGMVYRHAEDDSQPAVFVDSKYRQARGGIELIPYCPWCKQPMKQPPAGKRTSHQPRYYCENRHRVKLLPTLRWI